MLADAFGTVEPFLHGDRRVPAERGAISSVSAIISETSSRVGGCWHMPASVARVRMLIGLNATLPISLTQISLRSSASTGHFRPPSIIALLNAAAVGDPAAGLADREARALQVMDDAGLAELGAGVDDAADRALGRDHRLTEPPGSTASIRRPSCGPSRPWKYHHGMPFWPATTAVSSCISGSSSGPALA